MRHIGWWLIVGLCGLCAACRPTDTPARIVEISSLGVTPTPAIIYITPTRAPTLISTLARATPSPTLPPATPTPVTPSATPTQDVAQIEQQCATVLENLYLSAGDLCLGKPNGFFCNGGLPPSTEPGGNLTSAFALPGSLVDASEVTMVKTSPLLLNNSGGLLWLHLDGFVQVDAMLVGEVELRDITPPNMDLPKWQSFTAITTSSAAPCTKVPRSTLVLQSFYGKTTRVVVNGVSVDLNGTLAVQTEGNQTFFMALEGQSSLILLGQSRSLYAGQQLVAGYADTFAIPSQIPEQAVLLERARVDYLPVILMDRPILIPQPGFMQTSGNVNMRAQPNADSRLLYAVPSDQILSILGENPLRDWLHVRLGNGETGWMRADLLTGERVPIDAVYEETPQPPQRPGELGKVAVITAPQGGNLRRAPDVGFPVLMTVDKGTQVELLARSPYSPWVKVNANGNVGWMALITMETRAAVSFLPIDYDVPLPPRPTATPIFSFGGGHAYPNPSSGQ